MTLVANTLARTACRQVARRNLSAAAAKEPKLHKAKNHWEEFKGKRPVDHDDLHVSCCSVVCFFLKFQIPLPFDSPAFISVCFPCRLCMSVNLSYSLQPGYDLGLDCSHYWWWMGRHVLWSRPSAI
jgi:hypothetical protein